MELDWQDPRESRFGAAGFAPVELSLEMRISEGPKINSTRLAQEGDFPAIQELSARCLPEVLAYPAGCSLAQVLAYRRERHLSPDLKDPAQRVWVAESEGLQGYLWLDLSGHSPNLEEIAVVPSARGHRVAHRLLRSALNWLARHTCERVCRASVAQANPRSWKTALRAGFQVANRRWLKPFDGDRSG